MKYADIIVQTLLIVTVYLAYLSDPDSYIFIFAVVLGPWQLISALLRMLVEKRLRLHRMVYLGISLIYLVVMPLVSGKEFLQSLDDPSLFIAPAVLAFLYYLITIEALYQKSSGE